MRKNVFVHHDMSEYSLHISQRFFTAVQANDNTQRGNNALRMVRELGKLSDVLWAVFSDFFFTI